MHDTEERMTSDSLPEFSVLMKWSTEDVAKWLRKLKVMDAAIKFKVLNVGGYELAHLTESDIFQSGISMKSRKKILDYVSNIKGKDTQKKRVIIGEKKPPTKPQPDYHNPQPVMDEGEVNETPWLDDWSDEEDAGQDSDDGDYVPPTVSAGGHAANTAHIPVLPKRQDNPPRSIVPAPLPHKGKPQSTSTNYLELHDNHAKYEDPEQQSYEEPTQFAHHSSDSDQENYAVPDTEDYMAPEPTVLLPLFNSASTVNGHSGKSEATQQPVTKRATPRVLLDLTKPPPPPVRKTNRQTIAGPITPAAPTEAAPRKLSEPLVNTWSSSRTIPKHPPSSSTSQSPSTLPQSHTSPRVPQSMNSPTRSISPSSPRFPPRKISGNSPSPLVSHQDDSGGSVGSDSSTKSITGRPRPSLPTTPKDDLTKQVWYHADVSRDGASAILVKHKSNGMYLVRTRVAEPQCPYALSIFYKKVFNLRIRKLADGKFALGNYKANEMTFKSVVNLVTFYQMNVLILDGTDGTELKRPSPTS